MEPHAKHSPSALPYQALCPGWLSDPTPGPQAIRGTAIHAHLALAVAGTPSIAVMEDQVDAVAYGQQVLAELRERFPAHDWSAEVRVDPGVSETEGTADVVGVDDWSDLAVLIDWKSGRGDRADAGRSLQGAAYALGLRRRHPHVRRVLVVIVEVDQQWTTECEWLSADLDAAAATIRQVVAAAESATPAQYRPSEAACQYCARRQTCPAIVREVDALAERLPAIRVTAALTLTGTEVGALLVRYQPLIALASKLGETLEDRAKELLEAGEAVPGFELGTHSGTRDWSMPEDQVRRLIGEWAATQGAQAPDLHTIVSPAEAERRLVAAMGGRRGAGKDAKAALAGMAKAKKSKTLIRSMNPPNSAIDGQPTLRANTDQESASTKADP